MTTKDDIHRLVDELADGDLPIAHRFLEELRCGGGDSVLRVLLLAPLDDEPETEEEKQATAEARNWLDANRGEGIPHEETMRRLGLE